MVIKEKNFNHLKAGTEYSMKYTCNENEKYGKNR